MMTKNNKPAAIPETPGEAATVSPTPSPAWVFTMYQHGDKLHHNVVANVEGITLWDVAKGLTMVAAKMFSGQPLTLLTEQQQQKMRFAQETLQNYPAIRYYALAKASLCIACDDLYGHMLEGEGVPMPEGANALPCTFHLFPERRPCSFEKAAEILADLEAKPPEDQPV